MAVGKKIVEKRSAHCDAPCIQKVTNSNVSVKDLLQANKVCFKYYLIYPLILYLVKTFLGCGYFDFFFI